MVGRRPVKDTILQEKARILGEKHNVLPFRALHGWLDLFKARGIESGRQQFVALYRLDRYISKVRSVWMVNCQRNVSQSEFWFAHSPMVKRMAIWRDILLACNFVPYAYLPATTHRTSILIVHIDLEINALNSNWNCARISHILFDKFLVVQCVLHSSDA